MKTKTTLTVAGIAAALLLVVCLAVWLIVEHRQSDSAEHARRCAEFEERIAQDVYYGNTDAAQLDSRRATVYGCSPRQ